MPPAEYQRRFVNALDGYFVACPGQSLRCFWHDVLELNLVIQISGLSRWMESIGLLVIRMLFRVFCKIICVNKSRQLR